MTKKRLKGSPFAQMRICLAYIDGRESMRQLAKEFGVDVGTVSRYVDKARLSREESTDWNVAKLHDRWCKMVPKSWKLEFEDYACFVAVCRSRRERIRSARQGPLDADTSSDPAPALT